MTEGSTEVATDEEQLLDRLASDADLRQKALARMGPVGPMPWLNDNVKWIVVTLMIPVVTAIVGQTFKVIDEYRTEKAAAIEAQRLQNEKDATADKQLKEALLADARNDVQAMTALIPELASADSKRASIAMEVLTHLQEAQHPDSATQALFKSRLTAIDTLRNSPNEAVRTDASMQKEVIQNALPSTRQGDVTASAAPKEAVAQTKPERVYIQYFTTEQRVQAAQGSGQVPPGGGAGSRPRRRQ